MSKIQVFLGQIVHTRSLNELEIFPNGFLAVDGEIIVAVGNATNYESWRTRNVTKDVEEISLTSAQFLMPGFVDCHIHAPQFAQIGLGLDMELLDWLNTYTFPLEAKFADKEFALKVYKKVVSTTLRKGTTLASYFGTNHKESTIILAEEAVKQGQRAFVGKVCSDCDIEPYDECVHETIDFVDEIKKLKSKLVQPVITPRFAVNCSEELMNELGRIAKTNDLNIQSHISESVTEIKFVKQKFKRSYAQVYYDAGLLTNKTVMAHGVHLEDDEVELFRESGAAVAHCPASNTILSSGLCDVKRLLDAGVKVGLGTDVSGGNSVAIHDAILRTMDVSHHMEFIKKHKVHDGKNGKVAPTKVDYDPINYKQAIFLATLGGAEALAVGHLTGNFVAGKEFDALVIDTALYPLDDLFLIEEANKSAEDRLLELIQRFIYVGDDRNISKVFVAGRQVK